MKNWKELKERYRSWKRMKRKECAVQKETKRRGGKEDRDRKRGERRLAIAEEKLSIFRDLQEGWMLGDFRPSPDDVDLIRTGWAKITHDELRKIHTKYRSFRDLR